MLRWSLPFLCLSACVHAGVIIELVPTPPPYWSDEANWVYGGGELISIVVFARLDDDSPESIQIRSFQFDLTQSDPGYYFEFYPTPFWNLAGLCDSVDCLNNYQRDDSLTEDHLLRLEYLGSNPADMATLTRSNTLIGEMDVVFGGPGRPGIYLFDLLNPFATDPEDGAHIEFGPEEPFGHFRASDGTITGGSVWVSDIPEPATLFLLLAGMPVIRPRIAWTA